MVPDDDFFSLLLDARKRAAEKADEIKRLAEEKQKIREQELQAEAAADKLRLEQFVSKQLDASSLIKEQDRALQQILCDKERRQKEGEEAIVRRSAAMAMAKQNKAKKAELKRQRAIEAAKLKVEARSVELLDKARKKEELAKAQALLDREAWEGEQARDADEILEVEGEFLDMQLELERIEMSAKAATTTAAATTTTTQRVTNETNNVITDDESDNENDEIHHIRIKAATAVSLDVDEVITFDEIEDIDLDDIDELEQATPDLAANKKKLPSPAKKKTRKSDKTNTTKEKKGKKKSTDTVDSNKGMTKTKKVKTKKKSTVKQKISDSEP
jgi:hypothetical protein